MKKILFIWIFALAALAAGAQNPPTSLSERLGELEKELDKAKEDVEKAAAEMAACNKLPADQITSITNRIKQIKEEMDKVDNEKAKREKEIQKRIKQIKRQQAKLKKEAARATGFKNTKELNKALKRLQEEEKNAADTPPAALGGLQENMEKERSEEFKKIATEGAKKTDARTKEGKSFEDLLSDYDAALTRMERAGETV
jgi:chromosome segregation ATPase